MTKIETQPSAQSDGLQPPLHVAIVGAGIAGLALAIGLHARNVSFTVYERAPGIREIGAGLGLSPNAERAMELLDPELRAAFKRVANPNTEDYFQWIDGHQTDELIYKLYLGKDCFQGCRRSDLLEEVAKLVPKERMKFGKCVEDVVELDDGSISITFKDGAVEMADTVIGCDGIHSKLRRQILGEGNPVSRAAYTNKISYRALIPMDKARQALGVGRTSTRFMYNGPGAHIITYPIAMDTLVNVLVVASDPRPWKEPEGKHTARGSKVGVVKQFQDWHPTVRAIVDLLPEELDEWAIFDTFENPAPSYVKGSIGLAGDAAHAVGPHLGAGAGFGIEDALALATVLEAAGKAITDKGHARRGFVHGALAAYNELRYDRTQWLVTNTRDAVDLFQWRMEGCGSDPEKFSSEITRRFHQIWNYDVGSMVVRLLDSFATASG